MDSKLDLILEEIKSLKEKINDLWSANNMQDYKDFPPIIMARSPLSLTALGNSILEKYKGKDLVDNLESSLIEEIRKKDFKTPLDIQEFAERLIYYKFGTSDFEEIKNLIFHYPTWEGQNVNVKTLSMLMGLYLRDKYFKIHPDLIKETAQLA